MIFTVTQALAFDVLTALTAEDGPLDAAHLFMGLYTAGPDPTPPNDDSDFTFPLVADFPRQPVLAWSEGDFQPDGSIQSTSGVLDFKFDTFTDPTNFIGAFISTALTGGSTKAWGAFEDFIQFLNEGAHAKFVMRITVFLDSTYVLDIVRVDD